VKDKNCLPHCSSTFLTVVGMAARSTVSRFGALKIATSNSSYHFAIFVKRHSRH